MNEVNSNGFASKLSYKFKNIELLDLALTHSSYANQLRKPVQDNNERLEFLGDAVLDMVVSEYMYKEFPLMLEGELTKLRAAVVCETTLAQLARSMGVGDYIYLGKGEDATGGRNRDSILADTFESIIGAITIDGGLESAKKYVLDIMIDEVGRKKDNFKNLDHKTHLQEIVQRSSKVPLIYEIIEEKGPDHDKVFVARVSHIDKILGIGEGRSKKESEQSAANNAIEEIKITGEFKI